jgi:hypothetical protein
LARSIVKALLRLGCRVTVWCCKPEVTSQVGTPGWVRHIDVDFMVNVWHFMGSLWGYHRNKWDVLTNNML